jgi:hypothetical protein
MNQNCCFGVVFFKKLITYRGPSLESQLCVGCYFVMFVIFKSPLWFQAPFMIWVSFMILVSKLEVTLYLQSLHYVQCSFCCTLS